MKYSIGGNITTVHNEVLDLGGIPEIIAGVSGASTHRTVVGEPLGAFTDIRPMVFFKTRPK